MQTPRLLSGSLFSVLLWGVVTLPGCSGSADEDSDSPTVGQATGGSGSDLSSASAVPSESSELQSYLADGLYLQLPGESAPHESAGPHFGTVQTYLTPSLVDSLESDAAEHPVGAAAVKELFGSSGDVQGHAVMVKVQPGPGADSWYYYEDFRGSVFADGAGASSCATCHAGGQDYVLTPFPLR